ncbi:MAG: hypothetical protein HFJ51_04875, partial [Clostridia bacterium]|nr:hypothetical protein [Clostridia bacterium]
IDVEYLIKKTDTDAVREIMRLLDMDGITLQEKRALTRYIDRLEKKLEKENMDFRDFNISKMQAKKLISNE